MHCGGPPSPSSSGVARKSYTGDIVPPPPHRLPAWVSDMVHDNEGKEGREEKSTRRYTVPTLQILVASTRRRQINHASSPLLPNPAVHFGSAKFIPAPIHPPPPLLREDADRPAKLPSSAAPGSRKALCSLSQTYSQDKAGGSLTGAPAARCRCRQVRAY